MKENWLTGKLLSMRQMPHTTLQTLKKKCLCLKGGSKQFNPHRDWTSTRHFESHLSGKSRVPPPCHCIPSSVAWWSPPPGCPPLDLCSWVHCCHSPVQEAVCWLPSQPHCMAPQFFLSSLSLPIIMSSLSTGTVHFMLKFTAPPTVSGLHVHSLSVC